MTRRFRTVLHVMAAVGVCIGLMAPVHAEMILSKTIVDMSPGKPLRDDIEVYNGGEERMYVLAEPFEIVGAGTPEERRDAVRFSGGPGLLVSPQRIVLEPGERRTVRIGFVGQRPESDRIYRVTIKPVTGAVSADQTALKLLVGFDTLVLVRPEQLTENLEVRRSGRTLSLRNNGNTAQELFDGKQCAPATNACEALPAKRLYPGAAWEQTLPFDTPVSYKATIGSKVAEHQF